MRALVAATTFVFFVGASVAHADDVVEPAAGAAVDLGIAPVLQATPVWCWLAVGEMVFRYFDVPSINDHYQCGIVGAMSIATNQQQCARDCRLCNFGAGDANTMMGMIIDYPRRASILGQKNAPRIFATHADALTPVEVRRELDGGRPIVAGINPAGRPGVFAASAHVSLIVGYRGDGEDLMLIVNDPFPFSPKTWPDPYLANGAILVNPGRYLIHWSTYVKEMGWAESFLVRRDGEHHASRLQCLASSIRGAQRCSAAPTARAGERCACGGLNGVVIDGS